MMRGLGLIALLLIAAAWAGGAAAVDAGAEDAAAIRQVLAQQQAAWNRGDVVAFMHGYQDSPRTTFVGSGVRKGYRAILDSYRKNYAGPEQMGTLSFSAIEVRPLPATSGPPRYAAVTGRFHLDRARHGRVAQDDGVFSLLWQRTAEGWKIILDHSS